MAAKAMQPNPPIPLLFAISFLLVVWMVFITGFALWRAAKYNQRNWFAAILVLELFYGGLYGIIPLIYLFFFAKEKMHWRELLFWEKKEKKHNK